MPKKFSGLGFFFLRTPLLPWAFASSLGTDDDVWVKTSKPEFRFALQVATAELPQAIERQDRGALVAVTRYLARAAGRATPFGAFAGGSVGTFGTKSCLTIPPLTKYQTRMRLDGEFVQRLVDDLPRDPNAPLRVNATLFESQGEHRFVAAKRRGGRRAYALVTAATDHALDVVVAGAREKLTSRQIAERLKGIDPDVTIEDAEAYVQQVLESNLVELAEQVPTIGLNQLPELIRIHRAHRRVPSLVRAREFMERKQTLSPTSADEFRQITNELTALVDPPPKHAIQVDLVKPTSTLELPKHVEREFLRASLALWATHWSQPSPLRAFANAFSDRYDRRWVPLLEALDPEIGIGFDSANAGDLSPLLEGLSLADTPPTTLQFTSRDAKVLELLARNPHAEEIQLSDADLEAMRQPGSEVPDCFSVLGSVIANSKEDVAAGRFRVALDFATGPSIAKIVGRFCSNDASLERLTQEAVEREDALYPDAIVAEIVHVPQDRVNNIIQRPEFRRFEIPFGATSSRPPDFQIELRDLEIGVRAGEVILWSRRHSKRIIPRLSSAHTYVFPINLGIYRFLCFLQKQRTAGWTWGPFESLPALPRVVSGRAILAPRRWALSMIEKERFRSLSGTALADYAREIREQHRIPRFVEVADGDNTLPIDFESLPSLSAAAGLLANPKHKIIEQFWNHEEGLCVDSPDGKFVNEFVVPFVRSHRDERPVHAEVRHRSMPAVPGSGCLYLKLYCGPASQDLVLRRLRAQIEGLSCPWFFIRYRDPEAHLRIRLFGTAEQCTTWLRAMSTSVRTLIDERAVWRMAVDTYEPEFERYGGAQGVALAERIFQLDSEWALRFLVASDGRDDEKRWIAAGLITDAYLRAFDLPLSSRLEFARRMGDSLANEFSETAASRRQINLQFRRYGSRLGLDRASASQEDTELRATIADFVLGISGIAKLVRELAAQDGYPTLEALVSSYIHMSINRLARNRARAQEYVIYRFLERCYRAQMERKPNEAQ